MVASFAREPRDGAVLGGGSGGDAGRAEDLGAVLGAYAGSNLRWTFAQDVWDVASPVDDVLIQLD